jgi:predicted enzyme related to lactoylglutathione lyase
MSSIVHFEIPADDLQRAKTFYSNLFGWKFEGVQGMDYMMVDTYGLGGGMVKRMQPDQQIFVQIGVPSVDEYSAKVEKLGGKIIVPKKAIPGMGYFAICIDTENNVFGIVETDRAVPGKLLVSGSK